MKKALCMIALAAVCFSAVSATSSVRAVQDTVKTKVKKTNGHTKIKSKSPTRKIKKKLKDTTSHK